MAKKRRTSGLSRLRWKSYSINTHSPNPIGHTRPSAVQTEGVSIMRSEPAKPDDDKWKWDPVTLSVLMLVAGFVLLLVMAWSPDKGDQMIRHVKSHATYE